jgi:CubicO group peptidase (beta-lactamase class C family)
MNATGLPSSFSGAIDSLVTAAMQNQRVPGVALAVSRGGEMVHTQGFGYRSIPYRVAPDENTIFSIASISKQFTAAAVMRFVEKGRLSLDERVSRFFPALRYGSIIDIRHLLQHTSGIPGYTEVPNFDKLAHTPTTPDDIIATIIDRQPAFQPGDEWQYSNTNYVVLGRILELIDDASYAEIVQRELLTPLELTNTGVDDVKRIRENAADPYTSYALGEFEHAQEWDPSWEFAAGGLYSTCSDLVRWNRALRRGRAVSAESFALMSTSGVLNSGADVAYGFGLAVNNIAGIHEVRHAGGLPGFSLQNVTYPDLDIDIVVLANHDSKNLSYSIIRPILAQLIERPDLTYVIPSPFVPVVTKTDLPDPFSWVSSVCEGRVDELGLTDEFRRFLTRERRENLRRLASLGSLRNSGALLTSRRDPYTYADFFLEFENQTLIGSIRIRDDGLFAHIGFHAWDERPIHPDLRQTRMGAK